MHLTKIKKVQWTIKMTVKKIKTSYNDFVEADFIVINILCLQNEHNKKKPSNLSLH